MREIEGRDAALPCPYRRSICIEALEQWYRKIDRDFNLGREPIAPKFTHKEGGDRRKKICNVDRKNKF
jgi:hypothetical protein